MSSSSKIQYPEVKRDETVEDDFFGTKVKDPYRWLEDPDSKETEEWVNKQIEVTKNVIGDSTTFYQRLKEANNFPKIRAPWKEGDYYYFWKNDGLQNQDVLYMQKTVNDEPIVILDPNVLSSDGTASVSGIAFSRSGKYLSYRLALSGSDWTTVYVKDVETKETLSDKVEWVKFASMAWTHDNKGFYYPRYPVPKSLSTEDEADKRGTEVDSTKNQKIYYHTLGTAQSEDKLVFETLEEPTWMYGVEITEDGRYFIISPSATTARVNRLYYVDLQNIQYDAEGKIVPVKLVDNFDAQYSYIANNGTTFWLFYLHQEKAPRGKLIKWDISNPSNEFVDVIPHHEVDVLTSVTCVNEHFVVSISRDVKDIMQVYDMEGKYLTTLDIPIGTIGGASAYRKDKDFYFNFVSFLTPGTIYHYDFNKLSVYKQIVVNGVDTSNMEAIQVFYPSKDGTKIPMFIIKKKDVQLNGENPVLLYGYGGFNISLGPSYSTSRILWIQHYDGVYALANLRGGNEYGEDWHKGGIKEKKQNVFDDFQYAAKYLVNEKYTSHKKIAIMGGSNGGLLVNTCLNQAPDLFSCGISQVPVADMLRFHRFTIGHAWVSDYGCANDDKESFDYLYKYSPLHNAKNVKETHKGINYPATMILTADHDDRVVPAHSFKMISELQHQLGNEPHQTNPIVVRIDVKSGHGGGKPLEKVLLEVADIYTFVARYTGAIWKD